MNNHQDKNMLLDELHVLLDEVRVKILSVATSKQKLPDISKEVDHVLGWAAKIDSVALTKWNSPYRELNWYVKQWRNEAKPAGEVEGTLKAQEGLSTRARWLVRTVAALKAIDTALYEGAVHSPFKEKMHNIKTYAKDNPAIWREWVNNPGTTTSGVFNLSPKTLNKLGDYFVLGETEDAFGFRANEGCVTSLVIRQRATSLLKKLQVETGLKGRAFFEQFVTPYCSVDTLDEQKATDWVLKYTQAAVEDLMPEFNKIYKGWQGVEPSAHTGTALTLPDELQAALDSYLAAQRTTQGAQIVATEAIVPGAVQSVTESLAEAEEVRTFNCHLTGETVTLIPDSCIEFTPEDIEYYREDKEKREEGLTPQRLAKLDLKSMNKHYSSLIAAEGNPKEQRRIKDETIALLLDVETQEKTPKKAESPVVAMVANVIQAGTNPFGLSDKELDADIDEEGYTYRAVFKSPHIILSELPEGLYEKVGASSSKKTFPTGITYAMSTEVLVMDYDYFEKARGNAMSFWRKGCSYLDQDRLKRLGFEPKGGWETYARKQYATV